MNSPWRRVFLRSALPGEGVLQGSACLSGGSAGRQCPLQVVGDLIKGPTGSSGMRKSAEELEHFVQHPPTLHGSTVQVGPRQGWRAVSAVL